jgi:hypothetical protein
MPLTFIWERRTNLFGIEIRNAINNGYEFIKNLDYDEDGNVVRAAGARFNKVCLRSRLHMQFCVQMDISFSVRFPA